MHSTPPTGNPYDSPRPTTNDGHGRTHTDLQTAVDAHDERGRLMAISGFLLAALIGICVLLAVYRPWAAKNDHGPNWEQYKKNNINGAQRQAADEAANQ